MRKTLLLAIAATALMRGEPVKVHRYVIPVKESQYTQKLFEEEKWRELLEFSREGCYAGVRESCLIEGTLTATGRYGVENPKEAITATHTLCEKGDMEACQVEGMAWLMLSDFTKASYLVKKACDKGGLARSCAAYGLILHDKGDANATDYLQRGCEGEVEEACLVVSEEMEEKGNKK